MKQLLSKLAVHVLRVPLLGTGDYLWTHCPSNARAQLHWCCLHHLTLTAWLKCISIVLRVAVMVLLWTLGLKARSSKGEGFVGDSTCSGGEPPAVQTWQPPSPGQGKGENQPHWAALKLHAHINPHRGITNTFKSYLMFMLLHRQCNTLTAIHKFSTIYAFIMMVMTWLLNYSWRIWSNGLNITLNYNCSWLETRRQAQPLQ